MTQRQGRGRPAHPDVLTPAEWRVAELVRHGMSNPRFAAGTGCAARARWPACARRAANGRSAGSARWRAPCATSRRRGAGTARCWACRISIRSATWRSSTAAACGCSSSAGETPGGSILYFQVDDIHAAHDALAARGVAFVSAPHMIHRHADGTEEWMAFFQDPDQQVLALMAQAAPTVTSKGDAR